MSKRPLKKTESITTPDTLHCMCCNTELNSKEFYDSDSELHHSIGKIPYCKECLGKLYKGYLEKYKNAGYANPDRKAIERICMIFDVYYNDKIFDSAVKLSDKMVDTPFVCLYFKQVRLAQYRTKNYDTTILEKYKVAKDKEAVFSIYDNDDSQKNKETELGMKLFGIGFSKEDYVYLYEQYSDWTTRHECQTKSQEEVFKQICLTQLQLVKAARAGSDTKDFKDLNATLLKQLDAGNLQPKQNSGDAVSDAQTFGTLIDKWENTRPIPETDEELKDVDGIRKYTDVFFKGGLAKSLGLNIDYSEEYDEYLSSFTVNKPEYDEDECVNDALHEAIFGHDIEDNDSGE